MQGCADVVEEHAFKGSEGLALQRQPPSLALCHEWDADLINSSRMITVVRIGYDLQIMSTTMRRQGALSDHVQRVLID